jgi:tRNA-dihydrouridine synthase
MYAPSADPARAADVYAALADAGYADKVTLVGNGDIDGYDSAAVYLTNGCSEIAVGRAALGNPWIFAELAGCESFTPPTREEIIDLAVQFVSEVVHSKGEQVGIRESRGRAAHFIKGMRGSARVRDLLNHAETLAEFTEILKIIE